MCKDVDTLKRKITVIKRNLEELHQQHSSLKEALTTVDTSTGIGGHTRVLDIRVKIADLELKLKVLKNKLERISRTSVENNHESVKDNSSLLLSTIGLGSFSFL